MAQALVTIEQRTVEFYEDELIAIRGDDGQVYVAIRQMCQALGLDQRSQRRRIENHTVLTDGYAGGGHHDPPGPGGGGGRQQAALLRIDLVPLWLATLDMKRVNEAIRPKLERFQREAAKVLWEAFQQGRLTAAISQAVKAVAVALGKKSGRNEFGGVYGEMYRKFGISGYKMLPSRRFEEAMRWLADWHGEVTGQAGLPF